MLTNLITRLFRDSDSSNEDDSDPGFTAFMETLHARRAAQEWYAPGPEGDLYRQRCRDEEMMRMESRNYGFIVKMDTTSSSASSVSLFFTIIIFLVLGMGANGGLGFTNKYCKLE